MDSSSFFHTKSSEHNRPAQTTEPPAQTYNYYESPVKQSAPIQKVHTIVHKDYYRLMSADRKVTKH